MAGRQQTITQAMQDREAGITTLLTVDGLALSSAETTAVVGQLAEALRGGGLRPGRSAVLILPNGPAAAIAFLAATAVGAAAPLNPAASASEVAFHLDDVDPVVLVVSAADAGHPAVELARARGLAIAWLEPTDDPRRLAPRLEGAPDHPPPPAGPRPDDVALLLHTSGTTGTPKLVPLTHRNLLTSAHNVAASLALGPMDRGLVVMPLFHIHGLVAGLLAPLVSDGSIVCTPGFYAPEVLGWIEQHDVTWFTAVPTMHRALVARSETEGRTRWPRSLRLIRSSSSSLPPTVAEAVERLADAPVIEAYGMTEAAHQICSNPLPPAPRRRGSVGPAAGPEVTVLDDDGGPVPTGTAGEVAIRGANVTPGYVGHPARPADGWFRTGDIGVLDEHGYLTLTARRKEMINRGGESIAPREIDEALLLHPDVAEAVAFAVPDEALGEGVAAAVVPRAGAEVAEGALRAFAAQRLAPAKVPARVVVVDELPLGPSGKVLRIGMAERLGVRDLRPAAPAGHTTVHDGDETLEQLRGLWAEVLGIRPPGPDDDFLELGGDSMLATRLWGRVRGDLEVEVDPLDFFDAATCRDQAALLHRARATSR